MYVLTFFIFAFAMQIWFFSRLLSADKCKNQQICQFWKPCIPCPNLTCDPINQNDFERRIIWYKHRKVAQDAEGWRIIFVKKAWKFGIRGIFWCWIDLEGVPLKNMPRLLHAAAIMLHNSEICSTRAFWRKIFAICIKILVWGNFLMLNWSRRGIHQKLALVAACCCNYAA